MRVKVEENVCAKQRGNNIVLYTATTKVLYDPIGLSTTATVRSCSENNKQNSDLC